MGSSVEGEVGEGGRVRLFFLPHWLGDCLQGALSAVVSYRGVDLWTFPKRGVLPQPRKGPGLLGSFWLPEGVEVHFYEKEVTSFQVITFYTCR